MKISNSFNRIYSTPPVNRPASPAAPDTAKQTSNPPAQKINIPRNFQARTGLSHDEQRFFENLYPRARKEIGRYLQNQQPVTAEKGKLIDARG